MVRTLLTGFGPFGSVTDNPTARLVEHFGCMGAPGHALTTCVLPVSFARASAEVADRLRAGRYDAQLLLAWAGGAATLRIERYGRNRNNPRLVDMDGAMPADLALPDAPRLYPATMHV